MFQEDIKHIYPVFERLTSRKQKENKLRQRSKVIWLTGLSGSGKTTLSTLLEQELVKRGFLTQILDGDNIRSGINSNLGFHAEDRIENIRRIAEISKLMLQCGVITICACISPTEQMRQMAYQIIGREDVFEIFVDTPLSVCEQRDTKGLYTKARLGLIKNFTGIHTPFEKPAAPDQTLYTANETERQSVNRILTEILPTITF
ncbi:adenylyl-sulfate kinase [Mangrovibacterium lignilyticum]|uniref:adenylyl-sulfate kinase n=1 Tax=Mangrovibacterium lignilyticum TaxID=2668052 RepID=UPI0013D276FB|nr:adenylyl-sulfate kinase [Mangrovibacterium lignilyticum]